MPNSLTVTELARKFADYINRVAYRRETFLLVRGKKPIAELRPLPAGRKLSELPALLAGLPHLAPKDADAFAADLDEARRELAAAEPRDPWRS